MTTLRLAGLAALLITAPVYANEDIDDALKALAETVQSRSNSGWFSGVAIAAIDGVVVFEQAHGVADRIAGSDLYNCLILLNIRAK